MSRPLPPHALSQPPAIARGGKAVYGAPLGILMLEARFPRILGDMGNARTWPFPVFYRVVKGASPERVVLEGARGLLPDFLAAAEELVRLGAEAITTNCGFLSLFQREIAAHVGVPVDIPVAGTENGREFFRVLIKAEKDDMDVRLAEEDIFEAGRELVSRHPEVCAIVLECTNMPPCAAALQAAL